MFWNKDLGKEEEKLLGYEFFSQHICKKTQENIPAKKNCFEITLSQLIDVFCYLPILVGKAISIYYFKPTAFSKDQPFLQKLAKTN